MPSLNIAEGTQVQGADEEIIYKITTTNWGTDPATVSATAFNETLGTTVTTTVFPTNSPSVSGDIITLSPLKALVKNNVYRVEVKFTANSNIFECMFKVSCEM